MHRSSPAAVQERVVQQKIRLNLGVEPGAIFFRNAVGEVKYFDEHNGCARYLRYGLGEGSADLIGIVDGRFCALEVKIPGEAPRPNQARWAVMIRRVGAFYASVHSEQEAREALARCRKGLSE